jgi:hypothetical protein
MTSHLIRCPNRAHNQSHTKHLCFCSGDNGLPASGFESDVPEVAAGSGCGGIRRLWHLVGLDGLVEGCRHSYISQVGLRQAHLGDVAFKGHPVECS